MKHFDAQAARDALPFARLIPALRSMFIDGCDVPPRQLYRIETPAGGMSSLVMPAWEAAAVPAGARGRPPANAADPDPAGAADPARTSRRHYGVKIVNVAPGNAALGLPGLHASYLLFDAGTGVPLASIDGSVLTARRTAAASALAASYLASGDARRLLVIGAGAVARLLPEAYRTVLPIVQVTVWARAAAKAKALAAELRAAGIDANASDDLAQAVAQADVVSCATLAAQPLVQGRWLSAHSHLDLIGSFTPEMREADDACFIGAAIYVDTHEALQKSGDLLGPMSRGVFGADQVRGTLATLCRAGVPQQASPRARTVFKSVGTGLEDLAAAMLVHGAVRP